MGEPSNDARAWLAGILGCAETEIRDDASIVTHPSWDSFAQLTIMLELNKTFGLEIDGINIDKYSDYRNIKAIFEDSES
jgi:acyl carrier protein